MSDDIVEDPYGIIASLIEERDQARSALETEQRHTQEVVRELEKALNRIDEEFNRGLVYKTQLAAEKAAHADTRRDYLEEGA